MAQEYSQLKKSAHLLKTLGNIHRLQIIAQLLGGEQNVTHINAAVPISQPALSQHLARLRNAGVLGSRRNQREIYYFINNEHVTSLLSLIHGMGKALDAGKA